MNALIIIIIYILLVFAPFALIYRSCPKPMDRLINCIFSLLFAIFLYQYMRWVYFSHYIKYLVLIGVVFLCVIHLRRPKRQLPENSQHTWKRNFILSIKLLMICAFSILNMLLFNGRTPDKNPVDLSFPLKGGTYCVIEGGNGPIHNFFHYFLAGKDNEYALDITKLYSWGGRAIGVFPRDLKKYAIYQEIVYSPCDGYVTRVADNYPDIPAVLIADPISDCNVIQIQYQNYRISLAHLLKGSILVNPGEKVTKGQPLAQIGNSGSTVEPHLHIDVKKIERNNSMNAAKKFYATPYPFSFGGRFFHTNSIIVN